MNNSIILNSSIVVIIFLIIGSILYTITSSRSLSKRKKELAELHQNMKVGNEVMFSGGLTGKVTELGEEFVHIQLTEKFVIKVSRYAITQILS